MQYRRVFFDFQTGDGFEEVTNLVKFDDLTYTVRAGSDNFHYAQNTANISLIYDATIYGKVRDNTADIVVRIIDTDETADIPAVYTPLFWGHIAPTKSHTYNGIINNTILKLEVVDDGDYLKKEVGDVCYRGFRIMDSANPDYSIVHQLAYKTGFTVAQIDSAVSIPAVLNAFVPPSTSDDIRDLLDALLFEYGYTLAFNAEGEISPIKWMYTTADLSFTFNEDNIIDELDVNDRLKEYDGAEVTYYELGEGTTTSGQTDILLYRDGDLPYADDGSFLGYAVLNGYTYPPLTNVIDETTGEPTIVYQEYEDTAIKYWTNKAITEKLDYNYKAFTSDFSSIVATSGHYLDYKADAGVSLITSEFQNTQARIVFSGMNNTANLLYYCNVYGKVLYKTAERISTVVTISGSEDLDEYVSTFIFEKEHADTLVKFLALQHSTNNLEIEVVASGSVAVGAMVQVVADDGTNELCRVATKKYNEKTLQFTYTLYSYMYGSEATLPDLTSQSASSPSRIGGVTASVAVADLRAALGGALYVSSTSAVRDRAGVVTPSGLLMTARYKYDDTAYLGRFTIELSHDGITYQPPVYTSAVDEASYTYAIPTTMTVESVTYYVATIRTRLYASGGIVTKVGESIASILLESSPAPIYWGSLTESPPTESVVENDYYFDSNTIALGGGVLRVYNGTAWVEYTSSMTGYDQALWISLPDMSEWSADQNDTIAAANGIFVKLFAYDAYLANIFAKTITVTTGGRIRYETGAGVQKRCVQLANEKIDWIDTPDTTPATPEQLRFRLGRLGVGGAVLADGELFANIETGWSSESLVMSASGSTPDIIQQPDGTLRCFYHRGADGYIVQRTSTDYGSTWSTDSVINAINTYDPVAAQLPDGSFILMYARQSDGYLIKRTSIDGATWSGETVVLSYSTDRPDLILLQNGALVCAFRRTSDGYTVQITSIDSGVSWASGVTIDSVTSGFISLVQDNSGKLRAFYITYTNNFLVQKTSDDMGWTWSSSSAVNSAPCSYPDAVRSIGNTLICIYLRNSDNYGVQRTSIDGVTWSSETIFNAGIIYTPCLFQMDNGSLLCIYQRYGDGYLSERTLQRYARVGAGIVASGVDPTTGFRWEKYGNGLIKQGGYVPASGAIYRATRTFPTPFKYPPHKIGATAIYAGGKMLLASIDGLPTATTFSVITTSDLVGSGGIGFYWWAEGY